MLPTSLNNIFRRRPLNPQSSNGEFDRLPLELFHVILRWIPLNQIGILALTSERMRMIISDWIGSPECLKRAKGTASESLGHFSILCKRVTILLNTKERIKFMTAKFHKSLTKNPTSWLKSVSSSSLSSDDSESSWEIVEYYLNFGYMLSKFIRGWDESEYETLFQALDKMFSISSRLDKYLTNFYFRSVDLRLHNGRVSEELAATERHLRLLIRTLWWDMSGPDFSYRADWLLANMDHFVGASSHKQAIIIYLMFGPTLGGEDDSDMDDETNDNNNNSVSPKYPGYLKHILGKDLSNNLNWLYMNQYTPRDFHEGKKTFNRLAQCVCHLAHSSRSWQRRSLVDVLDKLFYLPQEWMRDNISAFLLFCNEEVILDYMHTKLDLASTYEMNMNIPARLLVNIMIEAYKFDNDLIPGKGVGNVIDKVLSYANHAVRQEFFETIWELLLTEFEETPHDTPIEEVIIGFGKFVSKKSIYMVNKGSVKQNALRGKKRKLDLVDSSDENQRIEEHTEE